MKITDSRSVARPSRVSAYGPTGTATSPAPANVTDVTTIMGIPDAELTPRVQSAILKLMSEVDTLRRDLEQSKARIQYLEQLADQDTLTPIANRRAFVRELTRALAITERHETPTSLVYFDLNGMKAINDSLGHRAGDAAIVKFASVLADNVRGTDIVGRLGGDEFAVVLTHADDTGARDKAEEIITLLKNDPLEWQGKKIPLALSYGVYVFTGGEAADEALEAADREMYTYKQQTYQAAEGRKKAEG